MVNVTARCENPDCGKTFTASRSDARFCGNRCRQAVHRRSKNPIAASAGRGEGRRVGTQVETVDNLIRRVNEVQRGVNDGAYVDFPKALAAPGAPLDRWDAQLEATIRTLTQLRRAIRDEIASNESEQA
jgi:hypothetical protein